MRRRSQRHSGPIQVSPYASAQQLPRWRRLFGWFCLLMACVLTVSAVYLVATAPPVTVASPVVATDESKDPTPTRLPRDDHRRGAEQRAARNQVTCLAANDKRRANPGAAGDAARSVRRR